MTAYGRAKVQDDSHEISVEISSVNKRNLDIQVRLSKELQSEETLVRKEVAVHVVRGQITVQVSWNCLAPAKTSPPINWAWIDGQKEVISQIAKKLNISAPLDKLCLALLGDPRSYLDTKEELIAGVRPVLVQALRKALESFDEHREREGRVLKEDFSKRISFLYEAREKIGTLSDKASEYVRDRLKGLLDKHVPGLAEDDRFYREVVLLADKADVSEELVRIDHHLEDLKNAMEEKVSGKLIEFLLQELLREFGTLGAKTPHAEVSRAVVLAKTEIAKMREQVANVE
jgi:uncharacterized protein (TIGR00255 family)